ncbi:type II toxin-antitoxin system RelE/ParE family toxin [Pontibacter sp. 172403-2]|uniref:type II toxin-antitoxin system RelE/ParE family toxin n=1 Tax=Pontibacter rufus TaxID=2791028 RepID=UPI0018AF8473|nr:type II toxin-antitoxin system RelE/ParE family toxin [Pontibacter sp. 172403-2]MBF9253953.1 type II toxin-antitoxin system RelE/ParE family toxin [Pontibacter sp. 172403-2]
MKQIIWSDDAVTDYYQTIDYLLLEWPEQVAITFIEEVEAVLDVLKLQPELYPLSSYPNVRRAVIRKQVTLYYTLKKEEIILVRFWNTYQNPDNLKI